MTLRGFGARALLVALVALAAAAPGITNGFAYDDVPIIVENPAVHDLRAPTDYFDETYWGPSRGHLALYRPLTILAYSVQWAIGGGSPLPFHAVNIALYVAVAVVAFAFLSYLLPPLGALVGGLVFAAHPVHVESVANVVGQAELWVALAFFGALGIYARARTRGPLDLRTGVAVGALYFVALFVKEHGIVLPAILLVLEWTGQRTGFTAQSGDWRRARVLALVLVLLATTYIAFRVAVLGVVTGDDPHWGLRFLSAPERWTVMVALLPEFARLLFWPSHLYADYAPLQTPILPHFSAAHLPGLAILVAATGAFVVGVRRVPRVAFAVAWMAITLVLISSALFPVGVLIAERTLFVPSFAAALLIGLVVGWLAREPGMRRSVTFATVGSVLVAATIYSGVRQQVWADNATLFSTLVVEAPLNFRGHYALGEFYVLGGQPALGDSSFKRAFELYPDHVPARVSFAQLLQLQGRCKEALPILDSARTRYPEMAPALVGTAICLLDEQRLREARALAVYGIASGWSQEALRTVRDLADSLLVANDSVDARNRWAREGRPYDQTGKRLRIIVTRRVGQAIPRADTVQDSVPSATVQTP